MAVNIDSIVKFASMQRASDVHLRVGMIPALRIDGKLTQMDMKPLSHEDVDGIVKAIVPENLINDLDVDKEVDFSRVLDNSNSDIRLRINVFCVAGNYGIAIRIIYNNNLNLEELGIPDISLPFIKTMLSSPRGLFLVTGPTGSGKSTSLAAMIHWINERYHRHVITIEDPIEYVYSNNKCVISQREVNYDTPSFRRAVEGSLRQDPDIILVGEMRDLATIEAAVTAAETGHLVLSTLHTTGAARTVDRIIEVFPEHSRALVRSQLASNLLCVLSQVLCPRANTSGRVAAFEVMFRSDAIANLIRESKTFRIQTELEVNQARGMISLDKHLYQLITQGEITQEEGLMKAQYPIELQQRLQQMGSNFAPKKKGLFSF